MTATVENKKNDATAFSSSEQVQSDLPPTIVFEDQELIDPRWEKILRKLVSFFDYEDDWDDMDGVAADPGVIESAIRIALTQQKALHPAPDEVAMTCNGTVTFETAASENQPFPITTLEVLSSTEAELYEGGQVLQTLTISK